jgi:hypothetical protein
VNAGVSWARTIFHSCPFKTRGLLPNMPSTFLSTSISLSWKLEKDFTVTSLTISGSRTSNMGVVALYIPITSASGKALKSILSPQEDKMDHCTCRRWCRCVLVTILKENIFPNFRPAGGVLGLVFHVSSSTGSLVSAKSRQW